jgi:hypothetical protein
MKNHCAVALLVLAALALGTPTLAQVRITGAISGTVTDQTDAIIPGATVQLKDEGTGMTRDTVTNESGFFQFPDLNHGTYSVTVTLQGFQKAVFSKVVVESGRTTDVRVKLTAGGLEETVTVEGTSPVLETTSNMISNTLSRKDIVELPLNSRDAFQLARLVPGAVAPQGTGSTHFNGMPGGVINPTIDGVNNSSNGFKSGGTSFFGTVPARLGAVEQVTVESAGLGGDAGVTGGVNLKFVTRRGTNQYRSSGFWQHRNEWFNANSYANNRQELPKGKFRRHDFGGNFGGPLVPTGPLREKLFVFMNYEHEYIPQTQLRSRTLLTPEGEQGIFRYVTAAGEQRTVNVLQMAAAAGFPSTPDPIVAAMLAKQASARGLGSIEDNNNLRTQNFQWLEPQQIDRFYPTARLDYQITPTLSLMGSWNYRGSHESGHRVWPFPDYVPQVDTFRAAWWITSTGLNWAINSNTHNEFRYGVQHSGDTTPNRASVEHFAKNGTLNGAPVRLTLPFGLSTLANDGVPITGRHYITTIYDTATLVRGNHTIRIGGNFRDTQWRDTDFSGAGTAGFLGLPRYTLGVSAADPVANVFTTATIPGIASADVAAAQQLYALLTGRVSGVATGRVVDPATLQYTDDPIVYRENWTSGWFAGVFVQDQWRLSPDFTLNYGMRWEAAQAPFSHLGQAVFPDYANLLGPSTRLFAPGELNGVQEPVMRAGKYAAKTDWVNPGPRAGFTWLPRFEDNLLGKIFGRGEETVIRGGYDITYYDEGTLMFSATAGNNPGQSQQLLLQPGIAYPHGGLTLQSPLPAFTTLPAEYKPVWPQADFTFGNTGFATMKDDLKMPWVQAWNIGVQRQIMKNTVLEVRYVGNKGHNVWHTYPLNEVNIVETGFLDEFRRAQNNLAINVANGRTGFANQGLPGQQGLPIFEAAFGPRGGQAALGAGQSFTSANFVQWLNEGQAGRLAQAMATNSIYICRMVGNTFSPCGRLGYSAPGPYPMNFFTVNPYAIGGNTTLVDDDSRTKYHSMQVQLRRRYAQGITMNVNYTLAKNWSDIWADNANQSHNYRTLRDKSLDWGPAPFDVRHVLQAYGTYDLPFGRERRWRLGNGFLDAIAGGWTLGGVLTAQSGTPFRLVSGRQTFNQFDSGVILANGHTVEEIQDMIGIRPGPGINRYWIDPRLIGPDGRANPEYLQVPTTPGELGDFVYLRGRRVWNLNASLNKSTTLRGRARLVLHVTMENVLNHPIFGTPGFLGQTDITSTTFGQTTNPINGARQLYLRTEISF